MVKKQIITQKLTIPVKTVSNGVYKTYDIKPALLEHDFYVNVDFVRQDAYDEVEMLQRAQLYQQLRFKSRESIMGDILLEPDVPTEIDKMTIEEIESGDPKLKLKRAVEIYREREMEDEARMAERDLGLLEAQERLELEQGIAGLAQGGEAPEGETPMGAPRQAPPSIPPSPPTTGGYFGT